MLYRKREISANPIQLHLKELYGECYPLTLAPNPEMKDVSYAGKTFGRCLIFLFQSHWSLIGSLFFLSCLRHHAPEVLCSQAMQTQEKSFLLLL